mmetsp:Transcript_72255/g.221257  ORF Transcript_72255/g.221257 Transcript_72255/m.221257 type:complete len:263 (+) Transcript_72255:699-1487(+)
MDTGPLRLNKNSKPKRHAAGEVIARSQWTPPLTACLTNPPTCVFSVGQLTRNFGRNCKWSCRFSPTPGSSCAQATPALSSAAGAPMPLRSSRCGEPSAPAQTRTSPPGATRTSRLASAPPGPPARTTPSALPPRSSNCCASALQTMCRFGRLARTSCKGSAVEQRKPSTDFMFEKYATPAPLDAASRPAAQDMSRSRGTPMVSAHAVDQRSPSSVTFEASLMDIGPPAPRCGASNGASSEETKCGNTSSQPQPSFPSAAHES